MSSGRHRRVHTPLSLRQIDQKIDLRGEAHAHAAMHARRAGGGVAWAVTPNRNSGTVLDDCQRDSARCHCENCVSRWRGLCAWRLLLAGLAGLAGLAAMEATARESHGGARHELRAVVPTTPLVPAAPPVATAAKPARVQIGAAFQACACGRGEEGLCKGQSVKSGGMRLPFGLPGSDGYKFREKTLRSVMRAQDFSENKQRLMTRKDLRIHHAHYPETLGGGKTRLTPVKKGLYARKSRTLRMVANANGPVSMPVERNMESTRQAQAGPLPLQQMATRHRKRALNDALQAAPVAAAVTAVDEPLSHHSTIAALRRELEECTAERDRLSEAVSREQGNSADLQRQIELLQTDIETQKAQYEQKLTELRSLVESLREEAGDPSNPEYVPLQAYMLHSCKFKRRVRNYTGLVSARVFDGFVEKLNCDGALDAVSVTAEHDEPQADGVTDGDADSNLSRRPKRLRMGARALQPKEAILFVLMRCRTGLDIIDIHALFGMGYSTACRYFRIYVAFLRMWLERQFPMPTEEQLRRAEPSSFKRNFPNRDIQMIIDANEQECESASNLQARRTTWSEYKHRTTNKFLGACSPCGACVFASTNYGGLIDDNTLTRVTGIMDLAHKGWTTLADKGFLLHAEYAEKGHHLFIPSYAQRGVPTYTRDETRWTNRVGSVRIHVERMFKRAQEWKILHRTIKISNMDVAGSVFKVCCFMTNFEPPLIRQEGEPLMCLAEKQWGRSNQN